MAISPITLKVDASTQCLRLILVIVSLVSLSFTHIASASLERMPKETGISGYINLGVVGAEVETNMTSTLSKMGYKMSDKKLDSINDKPSAEVLASPFLSYSLAYTWANTKSQLYIGNRLEDFLRFDVLTNFGFKQGVPKIGLLAIEGYGTTSKTKVWKDPYLTTANREETNKESKGVRFLWQNMFLSPVTIRYAERSVDIADEDSGVSLMLMPEQLEALNREGKVYQYDIEYFIRLGQHGILTPRLSYIDHKLDGAAMSTDGYTLEVSYLVKHNRISYVANMGYGQFEYDEINPIYGREDGEDRYLASLTVFVDNIFGSQDWKGTTGFIWSERDHDIDFYNSSIKGIYAGFFYQF